MKAKYISAFWLAGGGRICSVMTARKKRGHGFHGQTQWLASLWHVVAG